MASFSFTLIMILTSSIPHHSSSASLLLCNQQSACSNTIIECSSNTNCSISCNATSSCTNLTINAKYASSFNLEGCTYPNSCNHISLYCPISDIQPNCHLHGTVCTFDSFSTNLHIFQTYAVNTTSNLHIYAQNGWSDLNIQQNQTSKILNSTVMTMNAAKYHRQHTHQHKM